MNQTQFQKAAGISAGLAARWYPHITAAMKDFGITAPLDQAMFIAQCGHESLGFNRVVENFNYSIAGLADFVRYGRLTQDQANSLGRSQSETVLPLSASGLSPTLSIASGWVTTGQLMDGLIVGADLFK